MSTINRMNLINVDFGRKIALESAKDSLWQVILLQLCTDVQFS